MHMFHVIHLFHILYWIKRWTSAYYHCTVYRAPVTEDLIQKLT